MVLYLTELLILFHDEAEKAGVFHLLPVHSSNPVPVLSPVFKKHSVDGMLTELACLLLQMPFVQCLLVI
ncbi:hypothetical protein ACFX19_020299 [Malus domestica]